MQTQIRLSSLAFAALISAVLVAGAIALHPPLTRAYCIRFAGLIAGAGLVVTLYDRAMTAHARRRAEEGCRNREGARRPPAGHTPVGLRSRKDRHRAGTRLTGSPWGRTPRAAPARPGEDSQ